MVNEKLITRRKRSIILVVSLRVAIVNAFRCKLVFSLLFLIDIPSQESELLYPFLKRFIYLFIWKSEFQRGSESQGERCSMHSCALQIATGRTGPGWRPGARSFSQTFCGAGRHLHIWVIFFLPIPDKKLELDISQQSRGMLVLQPRTVSALPRGQPCALVLNLH